MGERALGRGFPFLIWVGCVFMVFLRIWFCSYFLKHYAQSLKKRMILSNHHVHISSFFYLFYIITYSIKLKGEFAQYS